MQSNCLLGIMKDKLASGLDKAQVGGFAPEDILNEQFQPKTKHFKKSRQKRPKTKHYKKSRQKSALLQSKSVASEEEQY